jgi:hypothetical protein
VAINALRASASKYTGFMEMEMYTDDDAVEAIEHVPSAQSEIAEKLSMYKCYITDENGLQHEVIHTGDIRRVTGWEI